MVNDLLIAFGTLGATLGYVVAPIMMWLGWDGVNLKLWRWKMRSGKWDASLYFDKGNNSRLLFKRRKGSRVRIHDATYITTPSQKLIYRFMGIPLRVRRENDPEDVDIWKHENVSGLTAKELDNVINEAESHGIIQALKQWLPVGLIIMVLFAGLAIGSLYLAYMNFEAIQTFAPELVKFFPEGLKP